MNFKFEIGMIWGIGGVVNLFVAFMDSEFALIWILFSLALIIGSDIWLLNRKITRSEEKKELFWAKHGVWSVGLLALIFGIFKHGGMTTDFFIPAILIIIVVVIQFGVYSYKLQETRKIISEIK